jgi:hypothetical protein
MGSCIARWLSVLAQLGGAAAATGSGVELLDAGSLGAVLSGSLRWPLFGLSVVVALLTFAGAVHDALARRAVPMRVLRWLFIAAVLAAAAQITLSSSFRMFLFQLCFGAAAGGFAGLRLLDRWVVPLLAGRVGRLAELVLFQLCLTAVLLELGLRLMSILAPSALFSPANERIEAIMARTRSAPGSLRYGFPCNSQGHYDTEFEPSPGRFAVLSIGDSFGVGVVPHDFHFTTVCERELGDTEVYSMGIPEIGPGGYLRLLRDEGLRLNPDIIVVNLFLGNDLWDVLRWNNPREHFLATWLDRRNVLLILVPGRIAGLVAEWWRGSGPGRSVGEPQGETQVGKVLDSLAAVRQAFPWVDDPMLEHPTYSKEAFIRFERKYYSYTHAAEVHGAYEKTIAALLEMRRLAGAIPIVVMLIPDEYQVDDELWRELRADPALPDMDRDYVQRRLGPMLESHGFPVLDLLPRLRAEPQLWDGHPHLYLLRDAHFNVRGNRVAGVALARFLKERFR